MTFEFRKISDVAQRVRAAAANSARLVVRTCSDFASACNLAGAASFNVYRPIIASCRQRAGI